MAPKNSEIVQAEETQLAQPQQAVMTPEILISQAIQAGTPVETMEKLMAMRDKLKAERAREDYFKALSDFQAECPEIEKTKNGAKTKSGFVAYKYAPLEDIVSQVKNLLRQHGFSYRFKTLTTGAVIRVICVSYHKSGHSEETDMESEKQERTGVMNGPQQTAATVTYLKRYAFCNAFGISTADEDNDGQDLNKDQKPAPEAKNPGKATDSQKKYIQDLLNQKGISLKTFNSKMGITSLADLDFVKASEAIERLKKVPNKKVEKTSMTATETDALVDEAYKNIK